MLSLRAAAGSVTAPPAGPSLLPPASWGMIFPKRKFWLFLLKTPSARTPAAYQKKHRAELTAYQAAAAYFKAHNIQKLPSLKQLKVEREELISEELISEKAQFYQKYRETHKAWLDLATAQQNLEALHRTEGRREMTRGGLHELDK